jgi:hypothetical protein
MATEVISYKGRNYNLVWKGPTKYGERAKLSFLDGSKEFWVDASAVGSATSSTPAPKQTSRRSNRNWQPCGYPGCSPSYCDECDGEGRGGRY